MSEVSTLGRSEYTMKSGVAMGPMAVRTAFFNALVGHKKIHMHTQTHTYTHTHIHTYIHPNTHTHTHTHTHMQACITTKGVNCWSYSK